MVFSKGKFTITQGCVGSVCSHYRVSPSRSDLDLEGCSPAWGRDARRRSARECRHVRSSLNSRFLSASQRYSKGWDVYNINPACCAQSECMSFSFNFRTNYIPIRPCVGQPSIHHTGGVLREFCGWQAWGNVLLGLICLMRCGLIPWWHKAPGSKSEPLKPAVDPGGKKPQSSGGWMSGKACLTYVSLTLKQSTTKRGNVAVHEHGHPGWRGTLNAAVSFSSSHWLMSQNGLFSSVNYIVFRALKWRKWPMTFEKPLCVQYEQDVNECVFVCRTETQRQKSEV